MSSKASPSSPRLNPFLFPSDTDFQFALLIAAVIGASVFAYNSLQVDVFSTQWHKVARYCLHNSIAANPLDGLSPTTLAYERQRQAQAQFEKICREPFEKSQATWILGGVGLLFIVASIVYWLLPRWLICRKQLSVFTAEDDPQIAACLEDLCRESDLPSSPTFLWNPLNLSLGGLTFGRHGRYYVALHGGLITKFYTDLSQFRAVIRHELAHLKNADVDKTYFAVAACAVDRMMSGRRFITDSMLIPALLQCD